jgi:hypothetical protein
VIYTFQPMLMKGFGHHNLRFGYDLRFYRLDSNSPHCEAGCYTFAATYTNGPLSSSSVAPIGQDIAALLLGQPTGGQISRNGTFADQSVYNSAFVQDDWKITKKLTFNLGLRYEYEAPPTETLLGRGKAGYCNNEVVMVKDFKIQILDGRTGEMKQWAWMPKAPADNAQRPYEMEVGDSICFINIDGSKRPQQILIKDRYRTFWVFTKDLKLVWSGQCATGHYPFALDLDGDGRQELMIGYDLFSPDGKRLWSHDEDFKEHSDGVALGNFSGDPDGPIRAYSFASDEGFIMFDLQGNVLKRHQVGHTQSPAVGKFRTDLPGLQLMCVNFWRNPGIATLFADSEGCRSAFRTDVDHDSEVMPISVPN